MPVNYIYRFTRIDQHFYEMLINKSIYFAPAEKLNDPYETKVPFEYDDVPLIMARKAAEIDPKVSIEIDNYLSIKENLMMALSTMKSGFGICCFSKTSDNLLMWAHYADSHRGVRLCFDGDVLTKSFSRVDVDYQKERVLVDRSTGARDEDFLKYMNTKSKDWEYEQEVRFLRKDPGLYSFPGDALLSIEFGLRCSEEQITTVQTLLKINNMEHVNGSLAVYSEHLYKLGSEFLF